MARDIYKFAAQNCIRFMTNRGLVTTEQLFQMPLKSNDGFDLNSVAKEIHEQLKTSDEVTFVEDDTKVVDPEKVRLEVAFEVVKDVIATKQEEKRAAVSLQSKMAAKRKLSQLIAAKKDEKLSASSIEELEKQLAEIENS